MKVLINIIKFISITILAICMISLGILTIVSSTILNEEYIISKLEETNFYDGTYELVKSNFEKSIYQSGLEEEVLNDICTEKKLKEDINTIISNLYRGTNKKIDTTEISEKLNENIEKSGVKRTSKNSKAIDEFVKHICDEYTDTLIHTKYESKINSNYKEIVNIINKGYNIISIALVVDIIILIAINNKKVSKDLQGIGIALFSTGTFELIVANIITSKVNIAGIKIFNDVFSKTIVTIIQEIISKIISLGVGTIIIAMIFIAIYAIIAALKANKTTKKHNKEEMQ